MNTQGGLIDKHIFENQIERVLGENQGLRALLQGGLIDKHIFENQTERVLGENQGLRALLQTHHISDDTGTEPTNESEYAVTPSQKRAGRPLCELFKRQLAQRNLKHRLHELHTPYPSYIGQPNHGSFNFPKGRRTITRADNIGELSHFCEGSDVRVTDGTSHDMLARISKADLAVSCQRICISVYTYSL
ncbi:hypothetical protein L2E82_30817 [Cichorium intybus]|uniref:Uncharacterized protein n=1 Tax=Cichorium intybus TaxID=13427 RepID=A0ACB9D1V3_CICIN|nr:hypothetical protein L2E82_30817 [Cichorium intybus]